MAVLDKEATFQLICIRLQLKNGTRARRTKKRITETREDYLNCNQVAKDISVCFDNVVTQIDSLTVKEVTKNVLLENIELERLQIKLGIGGHFSEFKIRGKVDKSSIQPGANYFDEAEKDSTETDFTKVSSSRDEEVLRTKSSDDEKIVVLISK